MAATMTQLQERLDQLQYEWGHWQAMYPTEEQYAEDAQGVPESFHLTVEDEGDQVSATDAVPARGNEVLGSMAAPVVTIR